MPYHWPYKLDDIDMEKEDINQTIYEVVNSRVAKTMTRINVRTSHVLERNVSSQECNKPET